MQPVKSIGLMSGTSVDGSISAAILRTDGDEFVERVAALEYTYESGDIGASRPVHHFTKAAELAYRDAKGDHARAHEVYPQAVERYFRQTFPNDAESARALRKERYQEEFLVRVPQHRAVTLAAVIECSTILHAEAVERLLAETGTPVTEIGLVGYHGQTLYHAPFDKITVQVGDAAYLAHRVGIPVMYDFRSNDVAHGGQGAPLAPVYHRALARRAGFESVCVLNLGGTANITVISRSEGEVVAFDTGPANGLIDKWVKERAQQACDTGSQFANKGTVDPVALQVLVDRAIVLADGRNYLDIPVPKSLDIRDYHYDFPEVTRLSLEDGCATLNAFTAECIVRGLAFVPSVPQRWIACGGGVYNVHVLNQVRERVKATFGVEIELVGADSVGWSSAAMEAELFAFLAVRCDRGLPITYPQTTGVAAPLEGGRRQEP
jgi:anhydro-N-acetylmuramic acid kinase